MNPAPELDSLRNEGVLTLNRPTAPVPEKTVVVLGTARGGTTMVASVLQALGVPMGERLGPVLEDVPLSEAVEARDADRLQKIIEQRNAAHPVWGWKRPSALEHREAWQGRFRNPHLIAVFRDPFAIANRNRISMLAEVFQDMEHSIAHSGMLVQYLRQLKKEPILLCSYEKALVMPESFVAAVDEFLGLGAVAKRVDALLRVTPLSWEYLDSSRITQSQGHLDRVDARLCRGWAFYPKQPGRAARVQVFVNGRLATVVEARLPRADVKEVGIHPTGLCGFSFDWPPGAAPRAGDIVDARVEGDTRPLNGSPRPFVE